MHTVILNHLSRSNRNYLLQPHVTLLGRNYWPTALMPTSTPTISPFLLYWEIPPVLAKIKPLNNHIVTGLYNPLDPQNATLIQTATHTWCLFIIRGNECSDSSRKGRNRIQWATLNPICSHNAFSAFPFLPNGSFLTHTPYCYLPWFLFRFNFVL